MRRLFLVLYGLSGAAGLIYEVLWTRQLTLLMGHTTAATSAVLAAFMGGLALGAALAGRLAKRVSEPRALQIYSLLELAIAASALLVPVALALARPLLAATYDDGGGEWFGVTRLAVSLIVLTVPTAAMGATLPFAARWYLRSVEQAGTEAGDLYAGNTIGAAIGTALAAFVLVPTFGLRSSLWMAAGLNVVAAIGAWTIARRPLTDVGRPAKSAAGRSAKAGSKSARAGASRKPRASGTSIVGTRTLAAATLALTGFAALVSEVVWTRVLALVIGPTTYAFGLMLTSFITGLGCGSVLGARLTKRIREPQLWLALLVAAFALASAVALWRIAGLPVAVAESIATSSGMPFRSVLWRQGLIAASILLPVAIVLGALFPVAVRVAARARDDLAQDLAVLYTSNTIGAICGSLLAGFALIPWLGLRATIVAIVAVTAAGAIVVAATGRVVRSRMLGFVAAGIGGVALAWSAPGWDQALLSSGAYKYASYLRVPDVASVLGAGTLEYYKEGATATVTVRRAAGARMLAIDGKIDASNASDMLTQRLLAHLPLLLHGKAKRVAIVGLGSGVTLGAALQHPVERADVLEISPEVIEASARFAEDHHRALDDPRARVIAGDGRTHLLLGRSQYDVIISEPSNPWVAGVASLFTREFFEAARRRLAAGGVLCQWAHTYDISPGDLRSIVATFAAVFPHGTLWLVGAGDLLLIGSDRPLEGELDGLAARMRLPKIAADLAGVSVLDAAGLLSMYVGGAAELKKFAAGAVVQSDNRMALEFSAPVSLYESEGLDNAGALRALAAESDLPRVVRDAVGGAQATAASLRARGRMHLQAEAYGAAYDAFARALSLAPDDPDAAAGLTRAAAGASRTTVDAALALLRDLATRDADGGNVPVRVALSQLLAGQGSATDAVDVITPAIASRPTDARPVEQLAALYADLGDADRLRPIAEQLQRTWPDRPATPYFGATMRLLTGRASEAVALAEPAVRRHPSDARLRNVLGVAYASTGRRDEARKAFEAALDLDARDAATYTNLALLDLETGQPARAVARLGEALLLDPDSPRALGALAEALERLGYADRAARVRGR
ncbi:MAG TPA: fused MFS/spermidine synthase [Vicinamibacterales bacterium]|nr:fused MFS/spermidine synthase [Vicinamibacterales bacterium]